MGMIHRMTDGENGYTGKPGREAWGGGGVFQSNWRSSERPP